MAKPIVSYLSSLKFEPKLWESWQAKYLRQIRLVLMLIISIVVIGLFGYFNLPRRLNPEIKIPIVGVSTVLPGAAPEDVESLLTVPLEDKLKAMDGIDTITSTSRESMSSITIQFLSSVDGDKARADVQSIVDGVSGLPEDATDPQVQKFNFEDQPIWNFSITNDGDPVSLNRLAKNLQDQLEELPKVDRVQLSGFDTQGVEVIINPAKAREYNLSPLQLSQAVKTAAASYPAGSVSTNGYSFSLTIDRDINAIEDLRNLRVSVADKNIRLGDIAEVKYLSNLNQPVTLYVDHQNPGRPTVQFFIYKTETANIDAAEQEAHKSVDQFLAGHPGYKLTTISNSAEEIVKQFSDLTQDFMFTVVLVFILLFIFLGFRQAIIASITVPLTFLSTFAVINALGLSLNFLTMFAFLIALGLLIDDTIVTVAAVTRYYGTGRFTPAEAAVLVWRDFIVPLWSTTITTIWAFVPLLLATGIIGEFIKSIPIVVTATMLSSTTIAVLITLPLMIVFLKPTFPRRVKILLSVLAIIAIMVVAWFALPKNALLPILMLLVAIFLWINYRNRSVLSQRFSALLARNRFIRPLPKLISRWSDQGVISIEKLSHGYMQVIDRILTSHHGKRNTLIAIAVFAIVAYALVPLGLVKNEFFPKQDTTLLYVSVQLPAGTTIEKSNQTVLDLAKQINDTPEVEFIIAEAGAGFSGDMGRSPDSSGALLTLHLSELNKREVTSSDIAQNLRQKLRNYQGGTVTVQELSGGPPAGSDIQISLSGDDLSQLDSYADKVVRFLEQQPGVANVNKSVKAGTSKLAFVPDKEKLAANGLTVDSVGLWLRTYASGFTLDTVKFGKDEEDITFRLDQNNPTPEQLGSIVITTPQGGVPLLSLGHIQLENNPTIINREGGKRTISISGATVAGANAQEKNSQLENFAKTELNLANGYNWKTGGVNEENQKSVNSIIQAMLVSFMLILITMVIEFRSFRQTLIALAIIPLSIAGVFYIFALTHTPLSFPALIGLLALFGIVVTHAIVVIEKINDNRKEGLPLKDAIVDAAGNRLEPVLLTSLATIVGLVPITLSDPLWRGLGGAIIAGLLFSGLIKLFFVPVTYYLFFKDEKPTIEE